MRLRVQLDEQETRRVIEEATEEAVELTEAMLVDLVADVVSRARASWPVRSGESQGLLRADGTQIRAARYAPYIRGGSTWRTLILDPLERGPQ